MHQGRAEQHDSGERQRHRRRTPKHSSLRYSLRVHVNPTRGSTPADSAKSRSNFSIVQRKVLMPNDLNSLTALEDRPLAFQDHSQSAAKPFQWRFTRQDLTSLFGRLACLRAA